MSSPSLSLGNGAWVYINQSLTDTWSDTWSQSSTSSGDYAYYSYSGSGWWPSSASFSEDSYSLVSIDFDGISESSSGLEAYSGKSQGYSLRWSSYVKINESGLYNFMPSGDDGIVLNVYTVDSDGDLGDQYSTEEDVWGNQGVGGAPAEIFCPDFSPCYTLKSEPITDSTGKVEVTLSEGEIVFIDLFYYQDVYNSSLKLEWQVEGSDDVVVVPADQMFLTFDAASTGPVEIDEPSSEDVNKG